MQEIDITTPEDEFSVRVNLAMAAAIEQNADVDALAFIAANTAHELYEHYGAGEEYNSFAELLLDSAFQAEEIEQWLDEEEDQT